MATYPSFGGEQDPTRNREVFPFAQNPERITGPRHFDPHEGDVRTSIKRQAVRQGPESRWDPQVEMRRQKTQALRAIGDHMDGLRDHATQPSIIHDELMEAQRQSAGDWNVQPMPATGEEVDYDMAA